MEERIQKIISAAGITSRRAAEQLITEGRVRVNGKVVTELGTKADASKDHIKVDGKLINPKQPAVYIMLNKPAGYVTTMADPEGRPTVLDLLKGLKIRVYPVGRLDYNTEGLLLLTNDGDFAHLITHPKHEFPKTYRAKVKGVLTDEQIDMLEQGVYLDDGKTAPAKLKKISKEEANSWLEITIHEGRKRQVRRMFDRVGHSVIKLKRVKTGNLVLGDLPEGSFRYLSGTEVKELKEDALKTEVRAPKPSIRSAEGQRTPRAAAGSASRGDKKTTVDARREKTVESWDTKPRRETRVDGRRVRAPRVPGQGALGRGPRRPPREQGVKANQYSSGTGMKAQKYGIRNEETRASKPAPGSKEGRETFGKYGEKGTAFQSPRRKTTAARMFGKTFSDSTEYQPRKTQKAADTRVERTPRRGYDKSGTGKPQAPGRDRKPYRSRS